MAIGTMKIKTDENYLSDIAAMTTVQHEIVQHMHGDSLYIQMFLEYVIQFVS